MATPTNNTLAITPFSAPNLTSCTPILFQWSGGVPPFNLELLSNFTINLSNITSRNITAKLLSPPGNTVAASIIDSVNSVDAWPVFNVSNSNTLDCVLPVESTNNTDTPPSNLANGTLQFDFGTGNNTDAFNVSSCTPFSIKWFGTETGPGPEINITDVGNDIITSFQLRHFDLGFQSFQGNVTTWLPFPPGTNYIINLESDRSNTTISTQVQKVTPGGPFSGGDLACLIGNFSTVNSTSGGNSGGGSATSTTSSSPAATSKGSTPASAARKTRNSRSNVLVGILMGVTLVVSMWS